MALSRFKGGTAETSATVLRELDAIRRINESLQYLLKNNGCIRDDRGVAVMAGELAGSVIVDAAAMVA